MTEGGLRSLGRSVARFPFERALKGIKDAGYEFDLGFTSVLQRAIWTMWHCLDAMDCTWLPVEKDWRLNERHYGGLQGVNKAEIARWVGVGERSVYRMLAMSS